MKVRILTDLRIMETGDIIRDTADLKGATTTALIIEKDRDMTVTEV